MAHTGDQYVFLARVERDPETGGVTLYVLPDTEPVEVNEIETALIEYLTVEFKCDPFAPGVPGEGV